MYGDYRDRYKPGTCLKLHDKTYRVAGIDVVVSYLIGRTVLVKDHSTYREEPSRLWVIADTYETAMSVDPEIEKKMVVVSLPETASIPEPPCTCDTKVLVSYGCQCAYSKWKHAKNRPN